LPVGGFEVVHVVVEACEHDGDVFVKGFTAGNAVEVFLLDVAAEGWVGAADVGDAFGLEFLLHAAFAHYVDFVLGRLELEDAGDVDCGAVGGAEDFVLGCVSCLGSCSEEGYRSNIPLTQ
jgi:hypothetical protein